MKDIKILTGCVAVLTAIAVGFVLQAASGVFVPLSIALMLSFMLTPGVKFLTRLKVPPMITTFALIALLLYAVGQGGQFVGQIFVGQADKYQQYCTDVIQLWKGIAKAYPSLSFGLDFNKIEGLIIDDWIMTLRPYIISYTGPVTGAVVNLLSKTVMVIVFLLFILLGSPYIEIKIRHAFPHKSAQVMTILDSVSGQIARFISVMTLISAATGLLVYLGLERIGVDMAPTWGVLAFFLNFIPTFGSIVASIPPILVSIVQFHGAEGAVLGIAPQVLWTIGWILAVQQTIGNIITPKVMGDSMNLSPVIIPISLLMWGWLWGVAGALLSMPIAGIIKIVCDNVEPLHMVGVLMSSGKHLEDMSSQRA